MLSELIKAKLTLFIGLLVLELLRLGLKSSDQSNRLVIIRTYKYIITLIMVGYDFHHYH